MTRAIVLAAATAQVNRRGGVVDAATGQLREATAGVSAIARGVDPA
jgi:hypothetical protein